MIFANRSYAILGMELGRVGAGASGPAAQSLLDLTRPELDFVALAGGLGVPAGRARTAGEFTALLRRSLAEPGPFLIEAVVPSFQ